MPRTRTPVATRVYEYVKKNLTYDGCFGDESQQILGPDQGEDITLGRLLGSDDPTEVYIFRDCGMFAAVVFMVASPGGPIRYRPDLQEAGERFVARSTHIVSPANTGVEGSLSGRGDSTGAFLMQWRFPVEMRVAPTISTYNPSVAASNTARNLDDSTNTTPNAQAIGTTGATITHNSVDATDANDRMAVHAVANARL